MAAPFFFIKKKSGELHPVQDYRRLNAMTIKNSYLLPLISELIDKLKGARYFMKLDVRWGYNNSESRRVMNGRLHSLPIRDSLNCCYVFGLTNSPATFQTMMNHLFHGLISKARW